MIVVDEKFWPLVVFRFRDHVSIEELEEYLRRQEVMLARRERTIALVLTDNLRMWEAPVLRRQAEWIKHHYYDLKRTSIGAALVIKSPVVRGMLKAVLWLQPMPQPHFVTSSIEEALAWLRARLHEVNPQANIPAAIQP
jgi:hypothetical protein